MQTILELFSIVYGDLGTWGSGTAQIYKITTGNIGR